LHKYDDVFEEKTATDFTDFTDFTERDGEISFLPSGLPVTFTPPPIIMR